MKGILISGAVIIALAGGAAAYVHQTPWVIGSIVCSAQKIPGRIKHIFHHETKVAGPRTILNVPPAEMPEVLAESYRLKPDNRFMLAVADVDHFFSGKPKVAAQANFRNGQWEISYKGEQVGQLPELPDFYDFTSVLSQWARYQDERYPLKLGGNGKQSFLYKLASMLPEWAPFHKKPRPQLSAGQVAAAMHEINADLARFMAPNLIDAARRADSLWGQGQHDPAVLRAATKALVLLDFQSMDRLEIGDALPAKALAMLAVTQTLTGNKCPDDEALLSFNMGYSNYAAYIGKSLPQTDPVGAYVAQDDRRLGQQASAPNSGAESHYMLLTSIASTGNAEAFTNCVGTYFHNSWLSLPVFKTGLDMNMFSLTPLLAQTMPSLVIMALEHDEGAAPDPLDYLRKEMVNPDQQFGFVTESFFGDIQTKFPLMIDNFESSLNSMGAKYAGPFLGPETYKAYYKGYFYSGLHDLGFYYLDELSSTEAATRFAGELGAAKSGAAADFRTWYTNLIRSRQGRISLSALSAQIDNCKHMGAAPFMRTFKEQMKYYSYGDPRLFRAAKDFVPHLDTRLEYRLFLGDDLAYEALHNLTLGEKLSRSCVIAAGSTDKSFQLWYYDMTGNMQKMAAILNAPGNINDKTTFLEYYQKWQKDTDAGLINKVYRQLLVEAPDNWNVSSTYAEFLKKEKQYPQAINVLRAWLNRRVKTFGLQDIAAHAIIARLYYDEKQYNRGWAEIKPYIQSEKGDAMAIGALLLDKLGREDDAEKLGLYIKNRYPGYLSSSMPLVEIYWRNGKYDEAASLLKSFVPVITTDDWSWTVGPVFVKTFKNKPKEAVAAIGALASSGVKPVDLAQIGFDIAKAGNNELAFLIFSNIKVPNPIANLYFIVDAYSCLKAYTPKETALAWLHSQIPPQLVNPLSMVSYERHQYEVLWEFNPVPGNQDEVYYFWLMRAAGSVQNLAATDPHRQELLKYYSGNWKDWYFILGKFLMGLASEKDVFAMMNKPRRRCEGSYYIGLKARAEGHYGEASDWFSLCLETGLHKNGEYRWAYGTLDYWNSLNESLKRLAKDKI